MWTVIFYNHHNTYKICSALHLNQNKSFVSKHERIYLRLTERDDAWWLKSSSHFTVPEAAEIEMKTNNPVN